MATNHLQRTLHRIIDGKLLPWARGDAHFVLMESPLRRSPQTTVRSWEDEFLPEARSTMSFLESSRWPEHRLVAHRMPCLCVTLEGDADMRTGITQERARNLPPETRRYARQTVTLSEGTFFVIPPHGVISQAGLHWEKSRGHGAHSKILWMTITPTGAVCHVCACRSADHVVYPFLYVPCARLSVMMSLLLDTMRQPNQHHNEMTRAIIRMILLRVDEVIQLGESEAMDSLNDVPRIESVPTFDMERSTSSAPEALLRAADYISANVNSIELCPETIARHCYQSASHLNRLFKAHFGVAMMQFVKQARLKNSENLLVCTDLHIQEVSGLSGFRHHSHFTRAFGEQYGCSPQVFRQTRKRTVAQIATRKDDPVR